MNTGSPTLAAFLFATLVRLTQPHVPPPIPHAAPALARLLHVVRVVFWFLPPATKAAAGSSRKCALLRLSSALPATVRAAASPIHHSLPN